MLCVKLLSLCFDGEHLGTNDALRLISTEPLGHQVSSFVISLILSLIKHLQLPLLCVLLWNNWF